MNASRTSRRQRWVVLGAVGFLVITTFTGIRAMRHDDGTQVYAEFEDASPLILGNDVKLAGVTVGQVESIEVRNGKALVGLSIEEAALPLHTDATASVRPVSLLGERFVELDRGSPNAPAMGDGATIDAAHTSSSVDLDQVLNALDEPTGQALAAFLTTTGGGLAGHGKDADAAIKALQPAMNDTDSLVRVLDQQSDVISALVTDLEPLAGAAATERGARLDGLLDATDQLLAVTAARQQELDATLAELPSTLRQGRQTLNQLAGAADATTPVLAGMRPTTDVLDQLAAELSQFADAGAPALESLTPTLERARVLIAAARPVAKTLRNASPAIQRTAHGLKPVGERLLDNFGHVLDFAKFWALTTNNADGLSNYFRSHAVVTAEPATGVVPADGAPDVPDVPGVGPLDDVTDVVGDVLDGLPLGDNPVTGPSSPLSGLLGGLMRNEYAPPVHQSNSTRSTNLTGLTARQEQSMVAYLLGAQS